MDRALTKRRLAVLGTLTLAVVAIKLIEDVIAKESGPVDEAILWFIRARVPAALNGFFAVITITGSAKCLVPLAANERRCLAGCSAPFRSGTAWRIGDHSNAHGLGH